MGCVCIKAGRQHAQRKARLCAAPRAALPFLLPSSSPSANLSSQAASAPLPTSTDVDVCALGRAGAPHAQLAALRQQQICKCTQQSTPADVLI